MLKVTLSHHGVRCQNTLNSTISLVGRDATVLNGWQPQSDYVPFRTAVLGRCLLGCCVLCSGCLSSPPKAPAVGGSVIQVSADYRDSLWEHAVVVLHRYHFQVARESKLEGVIETQYRGGSNLLEPWHHDSVGLENRLESTLQSIRRRVNVSMQSSGAGLMTVSVRVDKEIEDLPGLAANYEGGATFQESQPFTRDLDQVVGQTGPSRWLSIGRDPLLERQLLGQIQSGR